MSKYRILYTQNINSRTNKKLRHIIKYDNQLFVIGNDKFIFQNGFLFLFVGKKNG